MSTDRARLCEHESQDLLGIGAFVTAMDGGQASKDHFNYKGYEHNHHIHNVYPTSEKVSSKNKTRANLYSFLEKRKAK